MPHRLHVLWLPIATILAAIISQADSLHPALRILFIAPFVLILPGHALTDAIFPHTNFTLSARTLLIVGLSLAITALGGFLINATPWAINNHSWAIFLATTTLSLNAVYRHRQSPEIHTRRSTPTLSARNTFLLGLATLILISTTVASIQNANHAKTDGFTQLWMLPNSTDPHILDLGITNLEATPTAYNLNILANDQITHTWTDLTLQPGETWQTSTNITPDPGNTNRVTASLYRRNSPELPYRQVTQRLTSD